MKILLLGKNGQVGWELQRALAPLGDVVACDFDSPAPHTANFAQPESLAALVQAVRPDVIVNAAAHTLVDQAEYQLADLNHALESTLNVVWNELKYKAVVERDYGPLPEINCLASQINQIFMNLLINAAHAIQKDGRILIKTWADDTHVYVSVSDNGCGIPQENLSRIFDPFYTTKPVGKGTGLGLSLSYGIVKKHGGRIDVQSETGVGTNFTVVLPINQPVQG